MRRLLALTLGLALAIGGLPAAAAQTSAGSAIITDVDTSAFPDITLYAAVTDNLGRPVLGLTDFGLSENGQPVAASVSETIAGAQIVFLLDPNGAFKVRDEAGVTRLDFIKQGLGAFAQTGEWMRDEFDEVTIITPEGVLLPEAGRGGDVAAAVNGYDTDFSGAPDSLALLNQGLDYASAATPRPGMHRVLIVLSNGLGADLPDDVLNRAAFSRTRIHTLFVGPAGDAEIVGAQRLRRLAAQTGGLGLLFDGPASLTPVFQAVADARAQYQLTYRSGLNTTSENRLALRVALPEGGALEAGATFQLRVEPPVISLLLPSQIALGGPGAEPLPVPYELTFPDGHPRGIRSAQLVVDGEVVRQQIDPDGVIFWPLEADAAAMTRTVQIRLTDVWGIEAESAAVIVSLEAALAPASAEAANGQGLPPGLSPAQWGMLAVGLLLLLTAAGLGAGWVVHLRRRRAAAPRRRLGQETIPGVPVASDQRLADAARQAAPLPLRPPQPQAPRSRPALALPAISLPRFGRAARSVVTNLKGRLPAYLEIVEPGGGGAAQENIAVRQALVRLGRDPQQTDVTFADRSVSRLHARITEAAPDVFHIADAGSTSGTWVNYEPVRKGMSRELKAGDLINLGRVQLRFQLGGAAANGPAVRAARPAADAGGVEDTQPRKPVARPPGS